MRDPFKSLRPIWEKPPRTTPSILLAIQLEGQGAGDEARSVHPKLHDQPLDLLLVFEGLFGRLFRFAKPTSHLGFAPVPFARRDPSLVLQHHVHAIPMFEPKRVPEACAEATGNGDGVRIVFGVVAAIKHWLPLACVLVRYRVLDEVLCWLAPGWCEETLLSGPYALIQIQSLDR